MKLVDRRAFFEDLGRGVLLASLGPALLKEMRLEPRLRIDRDDDRLDFGPLEPLAALMQETPREKLVAVFVAKLKETDLKSLVAAAALANARTFGGEDYIGYHCAMALMPAWQMTAQVGDPRLAALPVIKVLRRNSGRILDCGGRTKEVLRRVQPSAAASDAEGLVSAERAVDVARAESLFAAAVERDAAAAFESLQPLVRENLDVHQVVLAWRSWDLLRLTGPEHARTMLRQSLRHCVDREKGRLKSQREPTRLRTALPRILEEQRLAGAAQAAHPSDDAAVDRLAQEVLSAAPEAAATAVAKALRDGMSADDAGQAIQLASVRLLLHDGGTTREQEAKPVGSVHGASIGVHASDSASAWRNIARLCSWPTAAATLVAAAWHTAGQSEGMDLEQPRHAPAREKARAVEAAKVPGALDEAIRGRDQGRAAALVEHFGASGLPAAPIVDVLLRHAIEADGALHHEKFFRTGFEEFESSRPAFRWLHLAALARVCASGYGFEAPGLAEARALLGA